MSYNLRARCRRAAVLIAMLSVAQPVVHAADKQRKAKEAEAKRLTSVGRTLEKQGHLLEAREQYLASEHVLFTQDAEKGLEHVAETADTQVKSLMASAAQAYAAENFTKAAQLLQSADALHPGHVAITCNLALTTYQQGDHRDQALTQLDACVAALRDKDPRRRLAELLRRWRPAIARVSCRQQRSSRSCGSTTPSSWQVTTIPRPTTTMTRRRPRPHRQRACARR